MKKSSSKFLLALSLGIAAVAMPTQVMAKKPNILVMWGDDVGYYNMSAYNQGMMGHLS
jgi:arylsulfatase